MTTKPKTPNLDDHGSFQCDRRSTDPTGRNQSLIGLRSNAGGVHLGSDVNSVQTSGYLKAGRGSAQYARTINSGPTAYRFQVADGRWFELAEQIADVQMFGATGDGITDDTAALVAAHVWLAAQCAVGVSAGLLYRAGTYNTTQKLTCPNTSGWSVFALGMVHIVQHTDNAMIFEIMMSVACSRVRIGGAFGTFALTWANNQPPSNTRAIGVAIGSSADIPDGLYDFEIGELIFDKGFRGISIHPDTVAANHKFPIWGGTLRKITSFRHMSGATLCLYSPNPNVGSPRLLIEQFYAQSERATEPSLILKGYAQVDMNLVEFNLGVNRQMFLESNRQITIDSLRFEQGSITSNLAPLAEVSGTFTQLIIRQLEVQGYTLNVSGAAYVVQADQAVVTIENVVTYEIATTSGSLYVAHPTNGGAINLRGDWVRVREHSTWLYSVDDALLVRHERMRTLEAYKAAVAEDTTASYPLLDAGGYPHSIFLVTEKGYLVGFSVHIATPLTAGTLTVIPCINDVSIASGQFDASLTVGDSQVSRMHSLYKGFLTPDTAHKVAPGDLVSFRYTTSIGVAPVGQTIRVTAQLVSVART